MKEYISFIKKNIQLNPIIICWMCVVSIGISLVQIFFAQMSKNIIDTVFVNLELEYLKKSVPILLLVYVLYSIAEVVFTYFVSKWRVRVDFELKCKFYSKINAIQYDKISLVGQGDIYYRMFTDGSTLSRYFYTLSVSVPCNLLFCVIVFIFMLSWSKELSLYACVLIVIQIANILIFRGPAEKVNRLQREVDQQVANSVMEKLGLLLFVKTMNIQSWWNHETRNDFQNAKNATVRNSFLLTLYGQVGAIIEQFWSIGFLILGAIMILNNKCSIGTFFGFQALVTYFITPLSSIMSNLFAFQDTKVAFLRFTSYFNLPNIPEKGYILQSTICQLSFQNIHFKYPRGEKEVFRGVNVSFEKDNIYAVVGNSGSGKSTLLKMAARLYLPEKGDIYIDNININEIEKESYYKNVGLMLQEPVIFNDSFKNNLCMDVEYNKEEINDILLMCGLNEVVDRLPRGLETFIGHNSVDLSLGEKQRISLARALLRRPQVLWLDEPTSALDIESEKIIASTIKKYGKDSHAIIIINTHREEILNYVDRIIDLNSLKERKET